MGSLIFLMCSERSGSNLITKILDAHPAICGPNTAHLADSLVPELDRYGNLEKADRWDEFVDDAHALLLAKNAIWKRQFTVDELRSCATRGDVAGLLRYVYGEEAAAHGKPVAMVKENRIYEFFDFLRMHFAESRYVYLYRDPRDMAASWKHSYAIRGGAVRAAQTWQRDQQGFMAMCAELEQQTGMAVPSASYEELVHSPEETLRPVCAQLGIAFDSAMLAHDRLGRTRLNAKAAADWGNIGRPIFATSVGTYDERLTSDEVRYVESACREAMAALGYAPASAPLSAEGFSELHERLSAAEPIEKPGFAAIGATERALRSQLDEVRARIHRRSAPME